MEQYISKSAVLAEIRKYKNNAEAYLKYHHNRNDKSVYAFEQEKLAMCELLSSLDTLEVKEVDLNEEIESYFKGFGKFASVGIDDCIDIAKHFFELGLKAQKGKEV
jgi:hypothetical protein